MKKLMFRQELGIIELSELRLQVQQHAMVFKAISLFCFPNFSFLNLIS